MVSKSVTLAQAAEASATSLDTVQQYVRIGLIGNDITNVDKRAVHDASIIQRLRFIQRSKDLGFSLPEIRELLQLDESCCSEAKRIAENKLATVRQKIADLQAMENILDGLVDSCGCSSANKSCGIIQLLSKDHN